MLSKILRGPPGWLMRRMQLHSEEDDKTENQSAVVDDMDDAQETPVVHDIYEPTVLDVVVVKEMLRKAFKLPPEIVDEVVDLAEYWPHTSTEIDYANRPRSAGRKDARGGHLSENSFLLRTPPLGFIHSPYEHPGDTEEAPQPQHLDAEFEPADFHNLISSPVQTLSKPCRKIVFTIKSHDQGWGNPGGEGLYTDSWTWFEVGLERCNKKTNTSHPSFDLDSIATVNPPVRKRSGTESETGGQLYIDHPLLPREDCKIQCNVTVNHKSKEHRVVWSYLDDIKPPTSNKQSSSENGDGDGAAAAAADDFTEEVAENQQFNELASIGRGKATGDGSFVRNLKLGDIVTVWAKARFPGWVNYVDYIKVDVYWAI